MHLFIVPDNTPVQDLPGLPYGLGGVVIASDGIVWSPGLIGIASHRIVISRDLFYRLTHQRV